MSITIKSAISSVKWDEFGEHMLRIYSGIYDNLQYTDCTLILIDGHMRANRLILGMASSFFENIFAATSNQPVCASDPLVVLIPDVTASSMRHVLQFIYTGEIRGLKSNDGRVQGASISDSVGANYETEKPVPAEQTSTQYYDVLGEHRNEDLPSQQGEEVTNDLSCIDTMLAEELEHMDGSSEDTAISKELPTKEPDSSTYAERLEKAIKSIVTYGTSFRKASRAYNISTSVLWRKTIKISRPANPQQQEFLTQRREAIEAIKAGEKLLTVSRRFDIPISTLHRDKMRLYNEGELPDSVALNQRDKGDIFKQRVIEAAQQCVAGKISLSEAARKYAIPKTTIWRKIGSLKKKPGCNSGLLKRYRTKDGTKLERRETNATEEQHSEPVNEEETSNSWIENLTIKSDIRCQKQNNDKSTEKSTQRKVQHIPANYVFM